MATSRIGSHAKAQGAGSRTCRELTFGSLPPGTDPPRISPACVGEKPKELECSPMHISLVCSLMELRMLCFGMNMQRIVQVALVYDE